MTAKINRAERRNISRGRKCSTTLKQAREKLGLGRREVDRYLAALRKGLPDEEAFRYAKEKRYVIGPEVLHN